MASADRIRLALPFDRAALARLEAGDSCLLTGPLYTLRDAGHVRLLAELEAAGGALPYGLDGQAIFYAGPTPEAAGRPFGAVGPTTASRMDFAAPARRVPFISWHAAGPRPIWRSAWHHRRRWRTTIWEPRPCAASTWSISPSSSASTYGAATCTTSSSQGTLSKGEGTTIPVIHESAQATDALRGIFITFEGGEGAGKTTHIRFLSETLRAHGREVLCLREPGGTEVGEQLRAVVLDPANGGMSDEAELLIYEAARAQLMAQVIAPALARGAVVLCDRFTDSTVAYQAYGRGLPRMFVDRVNEFACQGVHPDRTILMATGGEANVGLVRATHRGAADRLEQAGEEFHARVNEAFLEIARRDPERVRVVVSDGNKSQTAAAVFAELADLFPWMAQVVDDDPAFFDRLDVKRSKVEA